MSVNEQLRTFIVDNFMIGRNPAELTDTGSLLDLGVVDSTGVLEMVNFLEETYGIRVEDSELIPGNLDSIENLRQYIERKQA